jgi:hypothetical protein
MTRGGIRVADALLIAWAGTVTLLAAVPSAAQEIGTASGRGTIISATETPNRKEQRVDFAPRYAFAYFEGRGAKRLTWVVLTEKEPPLKAWADSRDRAAARQTWCEKEKAAFVAVQIDAKQEVYAYYLCPPGSSGSNTEMVSTINGLKSVDIRFMHKDAKRMKGTLRAGEGNCPVDGKDAYCTQRSDYTFDAPILP